MAHKAKKITSEIVDGPSKWDLMLCLFDPWPEYHGPKRRVIFKTSTGKGYVTSIESVERNEGVVSYNWIVKGDAHDTAHKNHLGTVKAYYNAHTRIGSLEVTPLF